MNDLTITLIASLIAGITTGAGVVWAFMKNLYETEKEEVRALRENNALLMQSNGLLIQMLTRLVTAIEYTDSLHDDTELLATAKEIKEVLKKMSEKGQSLTNV
jgi:uncharacterized protein HemX